MTRSLLIRGMLVGLVAGLLAFACARLVGEPEVERAIAFETHADQLAGIPPEPEMVSRKIQKGLGLFTGAIVYGTAMGGLFGLAFAFAWGRLGIIHPRTLSAVVASLGFVTIVLVPTLKYPANPPSVGHPETIGVRTGAFFLLIAFSVAVSILTLQIRRSLATRYPSRCKGWNASLLAAGLFVLIMVLVCRLMPSVDEVPADSPQLFCGAFALPGWRCRRSCGLRWLFFSDGLRSAIEAHSPEPIVVQMKLTQGAHEGLKGKPV